MEGPRGTKREEFEGVINLVNLVFRPESKSMQKEYPTLFNEDNLENLRIIIEDGKIVSHIGTLERDISIYNCNLKVGLIGAVCTHPDYRKRGYATLLLNDCIDRFEKHGCDFMLVSGALRIYDSIDCLLIGEVYRVEIREKDLWIFEKDEEISIENCPEKYCKEMESSYNQKLVKFIRRKEDWENAIRNKFVMNAPCEFLILKEKREYKGYLIVRFYEDKKMFEVREYAGEKEIIKKSIPHIFKKYKLTGISFPIPCEDKDFACYFQDRGVSTYIYPISGTVRVLNFKRMMEKMRPYFREKIGEEADKMKFEEIDGKYIISLDNEKFIMENRRHMTWTVLSRPGKYQIKSKNKLSQYIKEILPIPFVWYGINYI